MNGETTVTFAFIFSAIATIGLILNLYFTIKRDNKNQEKDSLSLNSGIMKANMKLDQVCSTTNGISLQIDKLNDKVNTMALKQENHETRIKILEGKHEKN